MCVIRVPPSYPSLVAVRRISHLLLGGLLDPVLWQQLQPIPRAILRIQHAQFERVRRCSAEPIATSRDAFGALVPLKMVDTERVQQP